MQNRDSAPRLIAGENSFISGEAIIMKNSRHAADYGLDNPILHRSRNLRKRQTPCEKIFWEIVRNRKFMGFKFLRQHVIFYNCDGRSGYFIADFYCYEKKLVVEIDGGVHKKQQEQDAARTAILENIGVNVIRIANEEFNDVEKIRIKLAECLK